MSIQSSRILPHKKRKLNCQRQAMQFIDHEWVKDGTPQEFTVFASHRPLTKQEQQLLPEGARSDNYRVINCDEELYVADDKLQVTGDIIVGVLGFDWRVVGSTRWGEGNRHNSYTIQQFRKTA